MTTNQTIDGVPRAWLEEYEALADLSSGTAQMLRALLDAPAEPKPTGLSQGWNLTRKHDGFVVGHQSVAYPPGRKAIERAERDGYVWVPFLVPAAQPQGVQMACMPVERCYDVRAKMIIAFNEAKTAGGDLDDALDAAYKSALRYSPNPLSADPPAASA
ncbi:hypothetical protein PS663_00852 [Pseudomonas fluorescens]|nr:hypothetical protein PS663_00852 [Pseudomonas fluorescens]